MARKLTGVGPVSDALLLEVAGISASLLGFFVVGLFFYVQRGMFPEAADEAQEYMQAAARSVIVLYGMTLFGSLALVALETRWVSFIYWASTVFLVWAVARTSLAIGRLHRVLDVRVMPQLGMWSAAVLIVAMPWALGGMEPSRSHLAAAIVSTGVAGFISSASLVLSVFDISRLERSVQRRLSLPEPTEVRSDSNGGGGRPRPGPAAANRQRGSE